VAVCEPHVPDPNAVGRRYRHVEAEVVGQRFDVPVVVALHQRDRNTVGHGTEEVGDFVALLAPGVADVVAEVTQDHQPVDVGLVDQAAEPTPPLAGPALDLHALPPEAEFDARVVVRHDQRPVVVQGRDGGGLVGDGLDRHQIGWKVSSSGS
jgi:hypothetical protein